MAPILNAAWSKEIFGSLCGLTFQRYQTLLLPTENPIANHQVQGLYFDLTSAAPSGTGHHLEPSKHHTFEGFHEKRANGLLSANDL